MVFQRRLNTNNYTILTLNISEYIFCCFWLEHQRCGIFAENATYQQLQSENIHHCATPDTQP